MDNLIDRESLNFEQLQDTNNKAIPVIEYIAYLKGLAAAQKMVNNAPTVEAKKVVHARWKKGGLWNSHREFFCSNPKCGESVFDADDFNFCPYCGAEMEGME